MATIRADDVLVETSTTARVATAIRNGIDAAKSLLDAAERDPHGKLLDVAKPAAAAMRDVADAYRRSPSDYLAITRAYGAVLDRLSGVIDAIDVVDDPGVRAAAAKAVGALLAANGEYNDAVRSPRRRNRL